MKSSLAAALLFLLGVLLLASAPAAYVAYLLSQVHAALAGVAS